LKRGFIFQTDEKHEKEIEEINSKLLVNVKDIKNVTCQNKHYSEIIYVFNEVELLKDSINQSENNDGVILFIDDVNKIITELDKNIYNCPEYINLGKIKDFKSNSINNLKEIQIYLNKLKDAFNNDSTDEANKAMMEIELLKEKNNNTINNCYNCSELILNIKNIEQLEL
jgi:nitrate/TMAO reductase-like tetraheme cytochrome c subunit